MTEEELLEALRDMPVWPMEEAADRIEAQAREIERLLEALQFYARENSWKSCGMYMSGRSNPSSAEIDRGDKARAALGDTQ
jgi:hypothetical protein